MTRWRANEGESFYTIDEWMKVVQLHDFHTLPYNELYDVGNYFQTEAEAQRKADLTVGLWKGKIQLTDLFIEKACDAYCRYCDYKKNACNSHKCVAFSTFKEQLIKNQND